MAATKATTAGQRAAARERTRKYRERLRAKAAASPGVTRDKSDGDGVTPPPPPSPAPTVMRDSVTRSLAAMKWLVDSDEAAKTQAMMLAQDVDEFRHAGDGAKALSAHRALTRVLDALGGTPMRRMMHELRSLRGAGSGEVPDDDSSEAEKQQAGNVTQFKRPPRRSQAG